MAHKSQNPNRIFAKPHHDAYVTNFEFRSESECATARKLLTHKGILFLYSDMHPTFITVAANENYDNTVAALFHNRLTAQEIDALR